jgi:radical SAM superfamily enzyme YgiQ (UPF0313 family)
VKDKKEKILLALLPFWDPQIPPLGIACLKSYLQQHGYKVKSVDANLEPQFRELRDSYYETLQNMIPVNKQGNIFNIGNQVMRNHLMVHLNRNEEKMDENRYEELLKILVMKTFFTDVDTDRLLILDNLLEEFYIRLKRYVMDLLARENPTLLGLTVYGDTFPASVAVFQWAKQKNSSIMTVMGGGIFADQLAPGSPELDYFLERSVNYIDKIIIGEGEALLMKLLRGELDHSQRVFGLRDLYHREESSGDKTRVDLSQIDVPDYRDFHLEYYPHLAHYGARSCPYQCKFCSETINWGRYRKKHVQQTVRELIQLQQRHSYQLFLLTDSTLNPIISALSKEFRKSGVTIYWDGFLRADSHAGNISNTLLWRRGGFYRAKLGLESGSQRVLDLMDKRITVEQSEATLAALAYAGIKTTTFWLFGFPGETAEDFQATLDFIEKNKDCIYEADCNAFNYYLTGQANSEEWLKNNRGILLYPKWAKKLLITQTWVLDALPTREEGYKRINRFVQHCNKLGIPNPYSLKDVYEADERWKKLHKNAVPSIVELKNQDLYLDENKQVKEFSFAENKWTDDGDWF